MKFNKNLKGFICMVLALVMIFGSTFAYFTDRAGTNSKGTAGTVGIDLTSDINLLDADGKDILNPGDLRDSSFGVENTGNKSIDVRTTIVLTSSVPMTTGENGQAEYELYLRDDVHFVEGEGWKPNDGAQPVQVRNISDDGKTIIYRLPDYILNGNEDFGDDNREIEEGIDTDFHDNDFVLIFAGSQTGNDFQASTVQIDVLVEAKQHRNTGAGWEIVAQEAYSNGAINQNAVLKADGTEGATGTNLNVANGLPAKLTMAPKTTYKMTNTVTNNSSTATDVQITVDMSSDDSSVFEDQLFGLTAPSKAYNYVDTEWTLTFGRRLDNEVAAYIDGVLTRTIADYLIVELVATTEEYPFDGGSFTADTFECTDEVVAKYIIGNDYGWEITHLLKGTDDVILKPRIYTPEGYLVSYQRSSRTLPYYVDEDAIYRASYNITVDSDGQFFGQKYHALLYHPYDGTIDISEFIEGSGSTGGYAYEKIVNEDGSVRYIFNTTLDSESGNTFSPDLGITSDDLSGTSATYVDMDIEVQAKPSSGNDWQVVSTGKTTITLDKTGSGEQVDPIIYTKILKLNDQKYSVKCSSGTYSEIIERATQLVGNTRYYLVENGTVIYNSETSRAVTNNNAVSIVVIPEPEVEEPEPEKPDAPALTSEPGLYTTNGEFISWEELEYNYLVKTNGTEIVSIAPDLQGTLVVPEGIDYIYPYAFQYSQLTKVILPSTVSVIGMEAFSDSYITELTLPEGVMSLNESPFYGMNYLQKLYLPNSLAFIHPYAFDGLQNVDVYYTGTEDEWFDLMNNNSMDPYNSYSFFRSLNFVNSWDKLVDEGLISVKDNVIGYVDPEVYGVLIVPEGITEIGDYAFQYSQLAEVQLPSTLKSIGKEAFSQSWISELIIPEGVTKLGDAPFYNNYNLQTLVLPRTLESVSPYAFEGLQNTYVYYTGTKDEFNNMLAINGIADIYCLSLECNYVVK